MPRGQKSAHPSEDQTRAEFEVAGIKPELTQVELQFDKEHWPSKMMKNLLSLLLVVGAANAFLSEGRSDTPDDVNVVYRADTPEVYEVGSRQTWFFNNSSLIFFDIFYVSFIPLWYFFFLIIILVYYTENVFYINIL